MCEVCDRFLVPHTSNDAAVDITLLQKFWYNQKPTKRKTKRLKTRKELVAVLDEGYILSPILFKEDIATAKAPLLVGMISSWDISHLNSMFDVSFEYHPKSDEEGISVFNGLKETGNYVEVVAEFPGMCIGKYLMKKEVAQNHIVQLCVR